MSWVAARQNKKEIERGVTGWSAGQSGWKSPCKSKSWERCQREWWRYGSGTPQPTCVYIQAYVQNFVHTCLLAVIVGMFTWGMMDSYNWEREWWFQLYSPSTCELQVKKKARHWPSSGSKCWARAACVLPFATRASNEFVFTEHPARYEMRFKQACTARAILF